MPRVVLLLVFVSLAYSQAPIPSPGEPKQQSAKSKISKDTAQTRNASPKAKSDVDRSQTTVDLSQTAKDAAITGDVAAKSKGNIPVNIGTVPRLSIEEVKDFADYALVLSTILLVGLGAWQLYLTKQAVDVAKDSADAANRSATALMNSERGWVVVDVKQTSQPSQPPRESQSNYFVWNAGKTPVRVTHIVCEHRVVRALAELEPIPRYAGGTPCDHLLATTAPGEMGTFSIGPRAHLEAAEFAALRAGEAVWYCYGRITYQDTFGRNGYTTFGFGCHCNTTADPISWRWEREGPPAYNEYA